MNRITVPDGWRYAGVQDDIDAGRLWKARDRLQGHYSRNHADQVVLDLLGSVWYAMGDLPQAGRHWFLTERSDAAATDAREAFHERFSHDAGAVLRALPRPAAPSEYPDSVRLRLEELASIAGATDRRWYPGGWKPSWWEDETDAESQSRLRAVGSRIVMIAIMGILLFGIAALVIGVTTLVGWGINVIA
jgi:hypothetical protein